MTLIEGGCLCRAVRYQATEQPLTVRTCWCRVCRYFACGNGSVNLAFARSAVTLTGELRNIQLIADSGNHTHRRFCPQCGVHVSSEAAERPHLIILRAGTLDDPKPFAPLANIWVAEAPSWAHIDPALPQFAGQPPPPALNK